MLRGETRAQVGRVVLQLKIRHDKGIDERPDLVGEFLVLIVLLVLVLVVLTRGSTRDLI